MSDKTIYNLDSVFKPENSHSTVRKITIEKNNKETHYLDVFEFGHQEYRRGTYVLCVRSITKLPSDDSATDITEELTTKPEVFTPPIATSLSGPEIVQYWIMHPTFLGITRGDASPFMNVDFDDAHIPLTKPTNNFRQDNIFWSFNKRRDSGRRLHAGIDIYGKERQDVHAMVDGRVHQVIRPFYGKLADGVKEDCAVVVVSNGCTIVYGEMAADSVSLQVGAPIKKGQKLGKISRLQGLNNPMLHIEIYDSVPNTGIAVSGGMYSSNKYRRFTDPLDPLPILDLVYSKRNSAGAEHPTDEEISDEDLFLQMTNKVIDFQEAPIGTSQSDTLGRTSIRHMSLEEFRKFVSIDRDVTPSKLIPAPNFNMYDSLMYDTLDTGLDYVNPMAIPLSYKNLIELLLRVEALRKMGAIHNGFSFSLPFVYTGVIPTHPAAFCKQNDLFIGTISSINASHDGDAGGNTTVTVDNIISVRDALHLTNVTCADLAVNSFNALHLGFDYANPMTANTLNSNVGDRFDWRAIATINIPKLLSMLPPTEDALMEEIKDFLEQFSDDPPRRNFYNIPSLNDIINVTSSDLPEVKDVFNKSEKASEAFRPAIIIATKAVLEANKDRGLGHIKELFDFHYADFREYIETKTEQRLSLGLNEEQSVTASPMWFDPSSSSEAFWLFSAIPVLSGITEATSAASITAALEHTGLFKGKEFDNPDDPNAEYDSTLVIPPPPVLEPLPASWLGATTKDKKGFPESHENAVNTLFNFIRGVRTQVTPYSKEAEEIKNKQPKTTIF